MHAYVHYVEVINSTLDGLSLHSYPHGWHRPPQETTHYTHPHCTI